MNPFSTPAPKANIPMEKDADGRQYQRVDEGGTTYYYSGQEGGDPVMIHAPKSKQELHTIMENMEEFFRIVSEAKAKFTLEIDGEKNTCDFSLTDRVDIGIPKADGEPAYAEAHVELCIADYRAALNAMPFAIALAQTLDQLRTDLADEFEHAAQHVLMKMQQTINAAENGTGTHDGDD